MLSNTVLVKSFQAYTFLFKCDISRDYGLILKYRNRAIQENQEQEMGLSPLFSPIVLCYIADIYCFEQVKADKYSARAGFHHHSSSPRTPMYSREETSNSLVRAPWYSISYILGNFN